MPIPRPNNLQPPDFTRQDYRASVKSGDLGTHWYGGRLKFAAFLKTIFQKAGKEDDDAPWKFLLRAPHIETNIPGPEDRNWEPVRVLGSGSFGKVGLWLDYSLDKFIVETVKQWRSRQ